MNLSLTDDLARYVESKIATGQYDSSEDVVRDALRLMERVERDDAEQLQDLQAAWRAGVESGESGDVDFEELKQVARFRTAMKA